MGIDIIYKVAFEDFTITLIDKVDTDNTLNEGAALDLQNAEWDEYTKNKTEILERVSQ